MRKHLIAVASVAFSVVLVSTVANAQPGIGITKTAPLSGKGSVADPLKITVCAAGSGYESNGTSWACAVHGDITSVGATTGGGLTGGATSGAALLGLLTTCSDGQILKWTLGTTSWGCAADAGGEILTAGAGLTKTGTTLDLIASSDFSVGADLLDLGNAITAPGTVAVAGTAGSTSLTVSGVDRDVAVATLTASATTLDVLSGVLGTASGTWNTTGSVLEAIGVEGRANGTVSAGANPLYMVGVKGEATAGNVRMGVHGIASTAGGTNYGGSFAASGGTANYAIYAGNLLSTSAADFAGYFDGRVIARSPVGATFSSANMANLIAEDTTAMAAGVGGQLNFRGSSTGSTPADAAAIKAMKTNAVAGETGFDLTFGARANAANVVESFRILGATGTVQMASGLTVAASTTLGDTPATDTTTINGLTTVNCTAGGLCFKLQGATNGLNDGQFKVISNKTGWGNITGQLTTTAGGSTTTDRLSISVDSGSLNFSTGGLADALVLAHGGGGQFASTLGVAGNATIGDNSALDTHTINGTTNIVGAAANTSAFAKDGSFGCNYADNGTSTCYINQYGYAGGTTQYRNLTVGNGNGGTIARFNAATTLTEMFGGATVYGNTTLEGSANTVGNSSTDLTTFSNGPKGINTYAGTHMEWVDEWIMVRETQAVSTQLANYQLILSGTAANGMVSVDAVTQRPGVVALMTGTSASGYSSVITSPVAVNFGDGKWNYEATVGFPILSTAVEEYVSLIGFFDSAHAKTTPVDGCFFFYDRGAALIAIATGDKWKAACIANGVVTSVILDGTTQGGITTVDSAVAALAYPNTNIYRLEVTMSDATSAAFKINGTTRATITTNIPTGSARLTGAGFSQAKHAGTTSRNMDIDQTRLMVDLTVARSP